jgi:hypothetical protein
MPEQKSEQERAGISRGRAEVAARMPSGTADERAAKREFIARQGEMERNGKPDYDELAAQSYRQRNVNAVSDVLGGRKKGGPIEKTGLYKMHEGETVIPAPSGGKEAKETTVRKVHGGHIVKHVFGDGTNEEHAVPEMKKTGKKSK